MKTRISVVKALALAIVAGMVAPAGATQEAVDGTVAAKPDGKAPLGATGKGNG